MTSFTVREKAGAFLLLVLGNLHALIIKAGGEMVRNCCNRGLICAEKCSQ